MYFIIDLIEGVAAIAIEVICCLFFMETFLKKSNSQSTKKRVVFYILLIIVIFLLSILLSKNIVLKTILTFISVFIMVYLCYETTIIMNIILSGIFQGILIGIDYLMILMVGKKIIIQEPENILIVLTSKMILFGIILVLNKHWRGAAFFNMLTGNEWVRFLYFPVITLIILIALVFNVPVSMNKGMISTVSFTAFGLIGMNILVLYLIRDIIVREREINNKNIVNEQIKSRQEIYDVKIINFEKQKRKLHEYKNNIECLNGLLREGNIVNAQNFIENIYKDLNKSLDIIDSNNYTLNAILNAKYHETNEKNIPFVFKVEDLSQLKISDIDLVTIISNLLNNAIEACQRVNGKRCIWFSVRLQGGNMFISCRNTYDVELFNDEKIVTTKEDKENHGLGIGNIRIAVEKYGGECIIDSTPRVFDFLIMIPGAY